MTPPARGWPTRPLALAVSVAVMVAGTGACGAGRNILGTNTGPCFMALPTARRAVEGRTSSSRSGFRASTSSSG